MPSVTLSLSLSGEKEKTSHTALDLSVRCTTATWVSGSEMLSVKGISCLGRFHLALATCVLSAPCEDLVENSLFQNEGKWEFLDPETLFSRKWGFRPLSGVGGIPTRACLT